MDAYLASRKLRDASHFYLNLNFEVLNGCKFNCRGCHVEKNAQQPIGAEDATRLDTLMRSFEGSLYNPFIAFVGPTDFLVAENFAAVFDDPRNIPIFRRFKRLSFQTTYLDIGNASAVADVLNRHYADREIEVNIVLDPARIMDDQLLALVERNKLEFLRVLGRSDVRSFGIMNVYDYDRTRIPELLRNYDFMHQRVQHLFETTIDYNFSAGRSHDLSDEEFIALTDRVKDLFNQSILSDEKAQYLRFSFGKLTDSLVERQYNYRNGSIYFSPLLYERFVSFRPEFEVPLVRCEASEIEEFEARVQLEQYARASEKEECESCPFLASCIDRGVLFLMDAYRTRRCLVARNALFAVNSMGALPIPGGAGA